MKFKENDRVILPANKEEGWVEERGIVIDIPSREYPHMYGVQIDDIYKVDEFDDGIREVHGDDIRREEIKGLIIMTRIEKALLNPDNREIDTGDIESKYFNFGWIRICPFCIDSTWEDCDDDSMLLDNECKYTLGCRGITCKECWNKEI